MAQQFFAKDDVIDFAQKLDADGFNAKAYRKRRTGKSNRVHPKQLQSNEFVLSELGQELKLDNSMQKTQRTTGNFSSKRFSSTAGVRKRSQLSDSNQLSFLNTGRTKLNSVIQNTLEKDKAGSVAVEAEERKVGSFSKEAREYAKKGQLKNKYIENWLNQILLQFCHDEEFDLTIENSALKKYGIDKNSLLSKGINPENLDRIFKSLFVYSMGFNTLLKQIGGKNMNIRKTFWKVYAILLEYCSDGDFQTMIAEIERDKVKKMDSMKHEIEKRQRVIDNNEEINQEKNARIFKELKELRENNSNLENDKNVLMEDFKEAEQAFNEEVSLRLKFENKINEIHGVHRELSIKHQKLYDDLQLKVSEYNTIKEKMTRLSQTYVTAKHQLEHQKKENTGLKEENKFSLEQIEELKKQKTAFELKEVEWKHKREELSVAIHQRDTKITQLKNQIKNLGLMLSLKEQSEKELQKEYQRSLSENKHLVNSLQDQLSEINRYMMQKKQFGDTHSKLYAEIEVLSSNLLQKQLKTQQAREQYRQLSQQFQQNQIELQMCRHKNEQLAASLADFSLKMEQVKKIKNGFEEEVMELRSKEEVYQSYYAQKEKKIEQLTAKIDELERKCSESNITKKTMESKMAIMNQKLVSDEQINKKKQQKWQQELKALQNDVMELKEETETKRTEAARYANLYEDTFNKLKDQLFQRNDLELKYNQSLSVVESENGHIKQLNIKISQYQEKQEELARKMKGLEFVMEGKEKTYKAQIQSLHSVVKQLKSELKDKKTYPHPMLYQDLLAEVQRCKIHTQGLLKQQSEAQKIPKEMQSRIQGLEKELRNTKQQCEKKVNKNRQEVLQYRQKMKEVEQQLRSLQQQRGEKKGKRDENSFKQKERKYLEFIKEKSSRIEDLLKQLQRMQDSNNSLLRRLEEAESKVKEKDTLLMQLAKEKQRIEAEQQVVRAEAISFKKEKQRLVSKLADVQEKFQETLVSQVLVIDSSKQEGQPTVQIKSREEQSHERKTRPGWRNDFANKVKNAVNYYKK